MEEDRDMIKMLFVGLRENVNQINPTQITHGLGIQSNIFPKTGSCTDHFGQSSSTPSFRKPFIDKKCHRDIFALNLSGIITQPKEN